MFRREEIEKRKIRNRIEHKETRANRQADVGKVANVGPGRDRAIELAVSTIEQQFGKGSIMRLGEDIAATRGARRSHRRRLGSTSPSASAGCRADASSRFSGPSLRARRRWRCTWSRRRSDGWHLGLRRRRTRARRGLCAQAGREHRRSPRVTARPRRAGAGNHRDAGALGRRRCGGGGLGGRADPGPSSKAKWATPTSGCRPA